MPGYSVRSRESAYLALVGIAVAAAYASVYIAQSRIVDLASLGWAAFFLALMLVAHLGLRAFAPLADPYLLPATGLLCGLGITEIYRLKPELASRQTTWLVVGVALFVGALFLLRDPRQWPGRRWALGTRALEDSKYVIVTAGALALLVTISPLGHDVRGAKLWISLGPVNIQPGEFTKLAIVVFLAAYLTGRRERLGERLGGRTDVGALLDALAPLVVFWGASLGLLVAMNDFGTSLLFYGTFLAMLFVATGRLWYVVAGLGAFVAGSAAVYRVAAHVQQRFDVWLDPWKDPQGSGYQLIQGLFALADGGLLGRGLGQAYVVTQEGNTLIPDAHTDFIFAVIADELGWAGAVGVLLLYVVITWRGMAIATACDRGFGKLLAFGLTATFALQTLIIAGGIVRMLPLTGQTLPFVSYGGSSVVANFLLMAMLLVVSHDTRARRLRQAGAEAGGGA